MKKIYTIVFASCVFTVFSQSQFTLTKAGQEPVQGDVFTSQDYDSIGVVPKNTGNNQSWNFSSVAQTTVSNISSYVSTMAVTASSLFSGATLVEDQGGGSYNFWKSSANQWELVGSANTSTPPVNGVSFFNSAIVSIWPIAPGNTFTDTFTGNLFGLPLLGTGSVSGTQTVISTGTGTITLPNGLVYNDVIQMKVDQSYTIKAQIFTISITSTNTSTQYLYFHATQKFQLLNVQYDAQKTTTNTVKSFQMSMNKNITIGIDEQTNLSKSLSIFPNPAKDKINIELINSSAQNCKIEIYNLLGQEVFNSDLGNSTTISQSIDISRFPKGTYILKTKLGSISEARKLVVE